VDPLPLSAQHPRPTPPPRPDSETLLLEAIGRRDSYATLRICQGWVHRRGLAELERFRQHRLSMAPDAEAAAWFEALLNGSGDPRGGGVEGSGEAAAPSVSGGALRTRIEEEMDAAIAAMLASFPAEQVAELPPQEAFSLLETLPDPARLACGSGLLETLEPPAELLIDPLFQGVDASTEPVEPPLRQPLSFRVEASSSPAPADAAPQPLASKGSEPAVPDPAFEPEEADSQQPPPRRSLGRRFPGAARALRGALNGFLFEAARAGLAWLPGAAMSAEASEHEASEQNSIVEEGSAGGASAGMHGEFAAAGESPRIPDAWIAPAPTEASRILPLEGPEPGAAARLRQRLSLVDESGTEGSLPAPRPSGLAELGAWLPDRDLPRAS